MAKSILSVMLFAQAASSQWSVKDNEVESFRLVNSVLRIRRGAIGGAQMVNGTDVQKTVNIYIKLHAVVVESIIPLPRQDDSISKYPMNLRDACKPQ